MKQKKNYERQSWCLENTLTVTLIVGQLNNLFELKFSHPQNVNTCPIYFFGFVVRIKWDNMWANAMLITKCFSNVCEVLNTNYTINNIDSKNAAIYICILENHLHSLKSKYRNQVT